MNDDLNDIEDFGATDDVIKTNIGDTANKSGVTKGDLPKGDNQDGQKDGQQDGGSGDNGKDEGNGEQSDEQSEKQSDEKSDGDSDENGSENDSETGDEENQSEEQDGDSEQDNNDPNEDEVEKKVPESYSSDEKDSDNDDGQEDKSDEKEGNEQQKQQQKDKNNKDKSKDDVVGQICIALGLVRDDENNYGVVSNFDSGDYTIRIPETTPILHNAKREQIVFAGDYVKFYIGGVEEFGNILGFNITERTCNIINWKSNEKWNDVDIDDINSLAKEDDEDGSGNNEEQNNQEQEKEEKEDEATNEQNEIEQDNLSRFKSLQFFVKFFLDKEKSKSYRTYIRYYKYGQWEKFHHQSFWLLNKKIVDGLDLLSVFNEENGDDLGEFINLDNSIMLNINMLSLKNKSILSELSDIKNIPNVLYMIIDDKTSFKECSLNYTSELDLNLNYELFFTYFGRKLFLFSKRKHEHENVIRNFFVLNVDKSNKRILGKVRNSESDKYIFNVYFSDFEKISYYEIFSYICYVLIWSSSKTNQIYDYSDVDKFVKMYLKTAKEILI